MFFVNHFVKKIILIFFHFFVDIRGQKRYYTLTFADKTDEKRPQIQYLCWFAALLSCHFFIVFFLFFCLCQNFFYFSQSSNAFAEIDIHGCPDIF